MAASRPQEGPSASAPSSSTSNTRSIRRRPSNRQAAFSFLSSIQLDSSTQSPTKHSAGITEDEDEHEYEHENRQQATMSNEMPSTPTLPVVTTHSNNNYAASKLRSDRDLQDTIICSSPITSVPSTPTDIRLPNADNRRSYVGKKEEAATNFLSTISLRGETSDDVDNLSTRASRPPLPPGQDSGYPIAVNRPTAPMAPSQGDLIPHSPVQRSSSTPSLASSWARNTSDSMSETAEPLPSGRHRKTTNLGAHAGRDAQPTHRRSVPNPRHQSTHDVDSSSGLLSTLLARESNAEPQSSSFDLGNTSTHRYMLQKASSRWLGPLTDHVYIKPLIASGTAHIVKKIFRRPSLSIPRHHSYSQSSSHQAVGTSRHSLYRTNSGSTTQLKQPLDTQRHIFYSGEDLANSCVSLGENLNQHAYMLTTKNGSPFAVSSILRYNDDKVPNKRRRRRFDREYLQQITKEALVRKKANSFAHLLTQSNALSPEQEEDSASYDPYYLDDPELKTGKNRTVISLACYMGSVIQYTRPSDLKRELNEHFRSRHPTIDPSITLSKIRKVKTDLLAISEELDLEISTAALAYAYFEKLIMKGSWNGKDSTGISTESNHSPVTKVNRKLMACVCLLLAYKVNEPKRPPGEFTALMKQMTKHMYVSAKDIKEHEFQVFSLLEFNLYLPRQEFLPHFEQILYRQDYLNVQEYLGEDEFYSVPSHQHKAPE